MLSAKRTQASSKLGRTQHVKQAVAIIVALGVLVPAAYAVITPLTVFVGGNFNVQWAAPTKEQGLLNCSGPTAPNCRPLNLAACTDAPRDISFLVGAPLGGSRPNYTGAQQTLYAFLSPTSSCVYSQITGQTGNNPNYLIGTNGSPLGAWTFFNGGNQAFVFPGDVSNFYNVAVPGALTTQDVLNMLGFCKPATATQLQTWFLCVGIDTAAKQGINNATTQAAPTPSATSGTTPGATSGGDPFAYLQFQIDTMPPAAPSIASIKPLNARAEAQINYDASTLDVYTVNLIYSSDPNIIATIGQDDAPDCRSWTHDVASMSKNVYGQAIGEATFTIEGLKNDTTYAVCATANDFLGNASSPSTVISVRPQFECDLFDCYPGELEVGFCAAKAAPQLWLGTAVALAARVLWRRKQRPESVS